MLKKLVATILPFFFVMQAQAGCLDAIHRLHVRTSVTKSVLSEGEDSFMKRIDRIEQVGTWLRRLKKDKKPAIHAQVSKRMTKLDAYLFVGDYATAHRELRTIFREVEFTSLAVKAIDKQLEIIRSLPVRDFDQVKQALSSAEIPARHWVDKAIKNSSTLDGLVDELVHTRSKYEVKLGSRFQEYLLSKEHLEALLEPGACSSECQQNTKRLLDSLGVKYQSDRTRFASFLEVGDELSSDIIRDQIDNHRLAVVARLKRERNAELISVFKEFATQPAIVQKILFTLSGIPGMHKFKIVRIFKLFLDGVAQAKHVPVINQIVRSQDDVATKLDKVLQQNGIFGGNEFLINFSRRSDLETKRVWNQIITEAGNRDEALASKLLDADKLGSARGPLELLGSRTPLPRWLALAASGAGIGYFWFGKTEIKEIDLDDIEPEYGDIPLDSEDDNDIDTVSEELANPQVQEVLLDSLARDPSSVPEVTIWLKVKSWLSSLW